MKNIIAVITLFVCTFFSLAINANSIEETTPAPEIIACESQGTCEMTTLEVLLQTNQEGLVDTKRSENAKGEVVIK
jgi:hypothetical protein